MAVFLLAAGTLWHVESRTGYSWSLTKFLVWGTKYEEWRVYEPARPWDGASELTGAAKASADELFRKTNIWRVRLRFDADAWDALAAQRFSPMANYWTSNRMILIRNPEAARSGLMGVMGYEYDWTRADLDFAGARFGNIGIRKKGNMASLLKKCPFKIDLNRNVKGQKLAGLDELTFNNLAWDFSCVGEALAYEFFRDCGVPAPRTAYAWLSVSVKNGAEEKPFGLYLMLEPVDGQFVKSRFASKDVPLFKPVTYSLFDYLGEDWSAYAGIYDLKTEASAAQKRRIIDFAKLLTSGSDAEFAAHAGEFLDFDAFARFLAGEVLISNYDSILALGQNFYMYLDPRSNKFGFIPWDLDASWGNFWIGSRDELASASLWHPWAGENRLLERLMKLEDFRRIYRSHLADFSSRLFAPERLREKANELAGVLRGAVAAESSFRLEKFEQTVGLKPVRKMPGETRRGIRGPARPFMDFIEARAQSVREQLKDESKGTLIKPPKL